MAKPYFFSSFGHKKIAFSLINQSLGFPAFLLGAPLLFKPGPMLSGCFIVGSAQVSGQQDILPVELVAHGLGCGEVVLPKAKGRVHTLHTSVLSAAHIAVQIPHQFFWWQTPSLCRREGFPDIQIFTQPLSTLRHRDAALQPFVQFKDPNIPACAEEYLQLLAANGEGFCRVRFLPVEDRCVLYPPLGEIHDHIAHVGFHQHFDLARVKAASHKELQELIGFPLSLFHHTVAEGAFLDLVQANHIVADAILCICVERAVDMPSSLSERPGLTLYRTERIITATVIPCRTFSKSRFEPINADQFAVRLTREAVPFVFAIVLAAVVGPGP